MENKDYATIQKEKIQQATEKLEQGILNFVSGEQYQDYLKVMSKFHNYSYSNSILIAMQRPDATLLAGYTGWQKKFKRQVLAGEHGIKIFAPSPIKQVVEKERLDPDTNLPVLDENGEPMKDTVEVKIAKFKVVTVFDVAQTTGEPLPELEIPDLTGNVTEYENFLAAIRRTADVPIGFEPIEGESHGYFIPAEHRIAIKEGMSEAQTLKTAIHELAHSRLHNMDQNSRDPNVKGKDRNTKEVEAESIAFVVCSHFGLDTGDYSFGYIGTWSSGKELPELKSSLQIIRSAATGIITEIESHLEEIQKEMEQDKAISQGQEQTASQNVKEPKTPDDEQPIYTIGGHKCLPADEWRSSDGTYFLMGKSVEQPDAYHVIVNESHTFDFEGQPARETVERTFADFLDQEYGVPDKDQSDQERNFRILPTDHHTYAVHSDSERFGTDATVFEGATRTECVDYIANQKEPEDWRFYVIPDLMTWQHGQSKQSPTALEHYDTISEAAARFQELRKEPYNFEEAPIPDTDRSYSRLTLGIEGVTTPSAVDVIHVEAGKNILCEDFTRLPAINTDRNALSAIGEIAQNIPIDQVNHFHVMTPEEVKSFTLAHLLDKLHREGVEDTSAVEAGFDAYYDSGGADYLKPSKNQQEQYELVDFSSWDNPYFSLPENIHAAELTPEQQFAQELAQFCREYDPYSFPAPEGHTDPLPDDILKDLSSGTDLQIRQWLKQVIDAGDEDSIKAQPLMERLEAHFPMENAPETVPAEPTISFYAAECMEFSNRGEYQDNLTLEEALAVYDSIPPERMNGIPCVGFHLKDGSIYEGDFPLMYGGQIDRDGINLVEHYRESPLVQKAISDLQTILDRRAVMQQRSAEREADPDEVCYRVSSMYLHIQEASDGSWDYTLYDNQLKEIDGGQIGDSDTPLSEVRDDLTAEILHGDKKPVPEIPIEQFEQMLTDREQNMKCPIFPKSLPEVYGTPEMETWRICHQANCACKEQFDKEYGPAYHDHQVPEFLQKMTERYGINRCKLVLASTIQLADHDGRYHPDIKKAAGTVPIPGATNDHHDVRRIYQVTCHPVMLDVAFRDLLAMEKEQAHEQAAEQSERKSTKSDKEKASQRSSVLQKLKEKQQAIAASDKKPPSVTHEKKQLE